MARAMSSAMLAALTSQAISPAMFVMATFRTGPVYLWSGSTSITWNGQTWTGIGTFGGISAIEEGADVQARGITLTTSPFNADYLAAVLGEFQLGLPVMVYFACLAGGSVITDPLGAWGGRMDQPIIDVGANTAVVSIACESRLIDMNTPVNRRFCNDDQQLDYPGDNGLGFVLAIVAATVYWGNSPLNFNNR